MEARGNALERLREENEGLTADYNGLRERFGKKEIEAKAAASAVQDLEKQLRAARSSAGSHRPDPQVTISMQRLRLAVKCFRQSDQHSMASPLGMPVAWVRAWGGTMVKGTYIRVCSVSVSPAHNMSEDVVGLVGRRRARRPERTWRLALTRRQ